MCEVTRKNFEELLPEIEYNLRKSSFISFDCEFSGINSESASIISLFDSPNDRYVKLKKRLNKFIILQFGLSTFQYNRDLNQYDANAYKFHVFPRSFGENIDPKFLSQASSFEFLCKFNFDFNKVLYDGLSYLNLEQQSYLRQKLKDGSFTNYVTSSLEIDEDKTIHEICRSFAHWMKTVSEEDVYSVKLHHNNERFFYALNVEVRKQFINAWCFREGDIVKLKLVTPEERRKLEEENSEPEIRLFNYYCGLSKIFDILKEVNKPIIGHNLLLDLLILHNQFLRPLPDSLAAFKRSISEYFPCLYDTKLICYEVLKTMKQSDKMEDTSLSTVYNFLALRGSFLVTYAPKIVLKAVFKDAVAQQIHDAGWDAYITGFSFIRLCHMTASKNSNGRRPLTFPEHLIAVDHLKNKVNLARASVTFIDLGNKESLSESRPPLLFVTSKKSRIDAIQLSQTFAKYGGFDVKPINNYSALLAVASFSSANDILKDFYRHNDIKVEKYTFFRHSQAFRYCLWAGIFVPLIGLGIALTLKKPEKHS